MEIDYAVAPKTSDVYLYPQILALGQKSPLTSFVRDLLRHFKVAPSQLVAGGWRAILSFEALCNLFAPNSHRVEDFSAL